MILINGQEVTINKFPDETLRLNPNIEFIFNHTATICWHFESNEEMIAVMFLTNHVRRIGANKVNLIMPYIPNARQDRVKRKNDVFTLKYFAEFINNLNFDKVVVLDPHSSVSEALINNIKVESPKPYIEKVINEIKNEINDEPLIAFYPDEGAMKRYLNMLDMPYAFGIKKRNWETGKIEGLDVAGAKYLIKDSNVIIVDDISSRGGTFYFSAKKLKDLGAKNVYLYISHCEKTIFNGEIFKSGLIKKVFTTNSIFTDKVKEYANSLGLSDKIQVFEYQTELEKEWLDLLPGIDPLTLNYDILGELRGK